MRVAISNGKILGDFARRRCAPTQWRSRTGTTRKVPGNVDLDEGPVIDPDKDMKSIPQGAATHIWCAVSQQIAGVDRKSTRLNSSHVKISYAVFCLKKKKKEKRK